MSLSAYLAKNYLTASSNDPEDPDSTRPKKRRKRDKAADASSTLIIADDDDLLLSSHTFNKKSGDPENDLDTPRFDTNSRSADFRRSKKNNWKDLSGPKRTPNTAADDEADRILAAAALDSERAREEVEMEDAPAIVSTTEDAPKMESGVRAGLQTAADTAVLELAESRRQIAEAKAKKMRKREKEEPDEAEATVYRDATGRRIDVSMKRAEARAAEAEKLRLERKEKEDAMGDVQKQQKETRKAELEDAKFLTVARDVDDEVMNEELKSQMRWDDPMAAYMASKQAASVPAGSKKAAADGGPVKPRRKEYQGAAAPNRYGIKPGWRWDGVDRGNGFEKEWFQARGKKSRNENLEYQWQMDE